MNSVFARKALLHKGWADNVRLLVRAGEIDDVLVDSAAGPGDFVAGVVIPGLCNAHSHAFQRALAGRTEERSPAGQDNFWTWRERMYALAGRLDADALAAIARQAYIEMVESGYTSVAEFHYLHRYPGSEVDTDDMFAAIRSAALDSGIRLAYIPVLYERAGFDRPMPEGNQVLFAQDLDRFLAHHSRVREQQTGRLSVGIGVHSLRAVSPQSLARIAEVAAERSSPLHLHIAEQRREVDDCVAANGQRPVEWLLAEHEVNENWCLVHATHVDGEEIPKLAETGAVVCLCPSTEANLGDGLFPLHEFLQAGGHIAIGSDSHTSINPFEELRWLEYGQRLASQSRNVASLQEPHVGRELYTRTLAGGAQASGQPLSGLRAGAAADLVALDDDDPMLVGHDEASMLDALVFSGYRLPIERVMVHGEWCVVDGDHVGRDESRAAYGETLRRIGISQ